MTVERGSICSGVGKFGGPKAGLSNLAQIIMASEGHDIFMAQLHAAAEFLGQIDIGRVLVDFRKPLPFANALRQAASTEYTARCAQRGFGVPGYIIHLVPQRLSCSPI